MFQGQLDRIERKLDLLADAMRLIARGVGAELKLEIESMSTLKDVLDQVQQERSQIKSFIAFSKTQQQRITDLLSGTTLPDAVQQQVDQIFSEQQENARAIVDAMNSNTPAQGVDPGAAAGNPQPSPQASTAAPQPGDQPTSGTTG